MPGNSALSPDSALAADLFDHFCAAQTFKSILSNYRRLCAALNLKSGKFPVFYPKLKAKLKSWKAQGLFAKFDKRASHKCYGRGQACVNTKVLVIGCGPCGLRAAIEAQMLGARVVVLEKRDRFSRNNVLHLWPMVIHDLKSLGAKKFFGKFCAGAIDHISIRQLQCILLKVALLLGVEVYENVGYEELLEPTDERTGWKARLSPPDHPASHFQFDVLIGADGKRNTFKCFRRKEFRGKLAIAITANFVNRRSEAEARVDEISGVAFIFNQKFFKDLYAATGIDLENIVYYKDETHYFVMTAKKQSLLAKGVILQDYQDTGRLLSPDNVNREKLMQYARQAADFSTESRLPQLPFALNHYGREDVAMFDFTCMYASESAGKVMERHGHKLLLQLVGDSLLEPFWPTGSGCARGFLSCFDAAWQIRGWANPQVTTLECLAERESIYRQLAQTTPRNLSCQYNAYTLDPRTRYPNLNRSVTPFQVRSLVDTDNPESLAEQLKQSSADQETPVERPSKRRRQQPLQADMLLKWCQKQLALTDIQVTDLTTSFKSGMALCGILHKYRPDLVDLGSLSPVDPVANNRLAFQLAETELGVPPVMAAEEMAQCAAPDMLAQLSYLSQVFDALHGEIPYVKPKIAELLREEESTRRASSGRTVPDGRRSSLSEANRKQRKRKSDAAKDKSRVIQDLKKDAQSAGGGAELSKKQEFASKIKDLEEKFKGNYQPPDKKPKDLNRAIGRIEKTDWNLQQIEKKIAESKRTQINQDRDQSVPMWSKDMFDDKYQAMQQLAERGGVAPETLQKYADIDQHLRRLELKLREGTTRDVGERGHNKVSQMAQQFLDRERPAPSDKEKAAAAAAGAAESCHFCNERVYLVERMSAENKFFHHSCFRCEYCGTTLKMMSYAFDQDSGRFFCMPHFGLHSLVKYKYQRKDVPQDAGTTPAKRLSVEPVGGLRGATPERAEFENSVVVPSEDDQLSEMDEDEWTDHNFGMSAAELTSEDVLDDVDSDEDELSSSDESPYEPALDEDEALRLAERWKRRHSHDPLDEPSDLYESDGDEKDGDDSDTATQSETEDDASARRRRQQEVRLAEDVLKSRNRSSRHGDSSDTETSSDSDSTSETSSEDEDATEVATDSEFDDAPPAAASRPLPTIVIENSAVSDATSPEPGGRPQPIGAEHAPDIGGAAGGNADSGPEPQPDGKLDRLKKNPRDLARGDVKIGKQEGRTVTKHGVTDKPGPVPQARSKTIANMNARGCGSGLDRKRPSANQPPPPVQTVKPAANEDEEEDSVAKIIREAKNAAQRRPYMIQRTESSEAIAWKSSLELKRKYLSEQTAPYAPCKSQSTTDLDSRVRTFMSRISETQRLLGAKSATPAPRPNAPARTTLGGSTLASYGSKGVLGRTAPAAGELSRLGGGDVISSNTSVAVSPLRLPQATPVPTLEKAKGDGIAVEDEDAPLLVPVADEVLKTPARPAQPSVQAEAAASADGEEAGSALPALPSESAAGLGTVRKPEPSHMIPADAEPPDNRDDVLGDAEIEESLTDISAVDSASAEARGGSSGVSAALDLSLSSGVTEGPDSRPRSLQLSEEAALPQTQAAEAVNTVVVEKQPDSLDSTRRDFDALVSDLDVTQLECQFDGILSKPQVEPSLAVSVPEAKSESLAGAMADESGPALRVVEVVNSVDSDINPSTSVVNDLENTAPEKPAVSAPSPLPRQSLDDSPTATGIEPTPSISVPNVPTLTSAEPLLQPSRAGIDVSRLLEENRALLSQIKQRHSSGEAAVPPAAALQESPVKEANLSGTAGQEVVVQETLSEEAAADSPESPLESAARDATELELSDWAHESEIGSAAGEFRIDDRYVTVRRGGRAAAERANLATLSDFEDVPDLPEDPPVAEPAAPQKLEEIDFADNSGEEEAFLTEAVNDEVIPMKNRGHCEYVYPKAAPALLKSPTASEPAPTSSKTSGTKESVSVKVSSQSKLNSVAGSTKRVGNKSASDAKAPLRDGGFAAAKATTNHKAPVEKKRSAVEALAESKSKYVKGVSDSKALASGRNSQSTVLATTASSRRKDVTKSSNDPPAIKPRKESHLAVAKITKENAATGKVVSSKNRSSVTVRTPSEKSADSASNRTSAPVTLRGVPHSSRPTSSRNSVPAPVRGASVTSTAVVPAASKRSSAPLAAGRLVGPLGARSATSAGLTRPRPLSVGPPPAQQQKGGLRVSPLVEQASARLLHLQRSPTDSVIVRGDRTVPTAAPAQGSLVRDLVLSRVKSPERPVRRRPAVPSGGRAPPPPPQTALPPATPPAPRKGTESKSNLSRTPDSIPPPATPPTPRKLPENTPPTPRRLPEATPPTPRKFPESTPRRPSDSLTPSTPPETLLPAGPPPPKPPRDPTLSLFSPVEECVARPGALRGALSRSTPSVVQREAAPASPDLSGGSTLSSRSPERPGPEGRSETGSVGNELNKKRERRKSIIQAISDIFKSGEKKDRAGSPPSERILSTSPTPPRSPFVKANSVRHKLAAKLSKTKERKSSEPSVPSAVEVGAPRSDVATAVAAAGPSPDSSLSESVAPSQYSETVSPEGTLSRRSKTSRAARHAEMRRLQRAQELQRQLDEVEVRQRDLEMRGVHVEKALRGEAQAASAAGTDDEAALLHEWFDLVHERSLLVRRDQLLQLQLRELQLEDRHDRLQLELRERMATRDCQKTPADIEREREVVTTLLELAEQRRALRTAMDTEQERLRAECETAEGGGVTSGGTGTTLTLPAAPAESAV